MKLLKTAAALSLLTPSSARFFEAGETNEKVVLYPDGQQPEHTGGGPAKEQLYRIELARGDIRWVTEDEKWALRRVSKQFTSNIMGVPYALLLCRAMSTLSRGAEFRVVSSG